MLNYKEYIYAIYQEKSFSKAAKKLYVSQPWLSSVVKKVEQEIKTDAKAGVTYAKYKLQSKKLSIQNLLCSKTDLWGEYEICLDSEKYKALLRALTFFDSSKEQVSIYDGWLERFVSFSYSGKKEKEGIFDETPCAWKESC